MTQSVQGDQTLSTFKDSKVAHVLLEVTCSHAEYSRQGEHLHLSSRNLFGVVVNMQLDLYFGTYINGGPNRIDKVGEVYICFVIYNE
jgi:hypothetical protein